MKLLDFHCIVCDLIFEELVDSDTVDVPCNVCAAPSEKVFGAPRIGLYSDPKSEATRSALEKRSYQHSIAQARKNPERIASQVGAKPAAQSKWNLRTSKK